MVVKFFREYTLKRASEEWMSWMFMLWKRELTSHNSFLSIFFPLLFSHFTRDFVGDFDILLMLKVGLKGDGKGWQQQRGGGGGNGGRGEGLWQKE